MRILLFALITSETHPLLRGVLSPPLDALTAEGYDMTFGTNVLGLSIHFVVPGVAEALTFKIAGHFYFTELLLPALYKASTPEHRSRVINLSSQMGILSASAFGSGLDFSTFRDSPTRRKMPGYASYGQSKFVSQSKISQFRSNSQLRGRRGILFTLRSLLVGMGIISSPSQFTQV